MQNRAALHFRHARRRQTPAANPVGSLSSAAPGSCRLVRCFLRGSRRTVATPPLQSRSPAARPRGLLLCALPAATIPLPSHTNAHAAVFENNPIRYALRLLPNLSRRLLSAQINGANLRTKVKGHGRQTKMFLKHRRQQVLARVLLHMVEAARPIDRTFYFNAFEPAVNHVDDFVLAVVYLHNLRIANLPEVVRLAARSRVKSRLIQDCLPCGGLDFRGRRNLLRLTTQNSSRKFSLEGIVVVEPACRHNI